MAAPLTKRQRTGHIDNIQTSKLINKLEDHVLNESEMSTSQVNAARILLAKTLPDQKATEHKGDMDVTVLLGSFVKPLDG